MKNVGIKGTLTGISVYLPNTVMHEEELQN